MRHLLLPLTLLTFLLTGSLLQADCIIPQGPPGPPPANYIGSYSETTQVLTAPNVAENVVFPNNFAGPVGITKSATNDSFTVLFDGVYLISWTVNGESPIFIAPPNFLALTLKVDGTNVLPAPISKTTFVGNATASLATFVDLSGQKLLSLKAGAVITLEVMGSFTPVTESLQIDSAMFNITQVSN